MSGAINETALAPKRSKGCKNRCCTREPCNASSASSASSTASTEEEGKCAEAGQKCGGRFGDFFIVFFGGCQSVDADVAEVLASQPCVAKEGGELWGDEEICITEMPLRSIESVAIWCANIEQDLIGEVCTVCDEEPTVGGGQSLGIKGDLEVAQRERTIR